MESSLPQQKRKANTRRWLMTAFLIYGTMVFGLLGFLLIFPGAITHEGVIQSTGAVAAAKPARFEAVIANWNRYRARDARAEAR
jgi:hypothetical protein